MPDFHPDLTSSPFPVNMVHRHVAQGLGMQPLFGPVGHSIDKGENDGIKSFDHASLGNAVASF